jgi:hypothetical protein
VIARVSRGQMRPRAFDFGAPGLAPQPGRSRTLLAMTTRFLAMQLAVASHYGDERVHALVRRLWSATRGAAYIPTEIRLEIEACAQDLLSIVREPEPGRDEPFRAAQARVEDVFVALALLAPSSAA